ncbi:MAG TPA: DUF3592 domain-containing protein [Tepidisphaeraceae bacterium]|nr:DUF3592 domain-containing protein [Tepidisphaeraceae bacterium]
MRLFIALFTAIPLVLMFLGLTTVARQHQAVAGAVATPATIVGGPGYAISSTFQKGRRTTKYVLKVDYRYEVNGVTYAGAAVFPRFPGLTFNVPGDEKQRPPQAPGLPADLPDADGPDTIADKAEADRIVASLRAGRPVTAWYDPANPARAFLVRRVEFMPYLLVLGPMIHLSVGLGLLLGGVAARNRAVAGRPIPAKNGWFELPVRRALARRRRPWAVIALVWFAVGGPVAAHYAFLAAGGPWDGVAYYALPAYFALGLVPLVGWVYYHRLTRNLRDARVWINTASPVVGKTFQGRAEQVFNAPLAITECRLGLVQLTHDRRSDGNKVRYSTTAWEAEWGKPVAHAAAPTTEPVVAKGSFKVPSDVPDPTPPGFRGYPRVEWVMRVRVQIPNHPDYTADFPLLVSLPEDARGRRPEPRNPETVWEAIKRHQG